MLGVVLGVLAVAAAVYLTRRCLVRHRSAPPDPGFEVDTPTNPNEIVPFMAPAHGPPAQPLQRRDTKSRLLRPHSFLPSFLTGGASMRKVHRSTMDDLLSPRSASGAGPSAAFVGPSGVIHEEDAEDVELGQVLPPMYREAWAERRSMELRDGAAGVTRDEKGHRAEDHGTMLLDKGPTGGPATVGWPADIGEEPAEEGGGGGGGKVQH